MSALPIEGVGETVLVEMHQGLDGVARHGEIRQDHRAGGVVVPVVMRGELVGPHETAVPRPARQYTRAPLVVPGSLLRVVGGGITGAVVEEIELRIVGQPSPHRRTTGAPAVVAPALRAEVRALIVRRLEGAGLGAHLLIRAHIAGAPDEASAAELQALDPSVDTEFPARGANNDAIPYYERRHGSGLTVAN